MSKSLTQDQQAMRHAGLNMDERKKIWLEISDISEEQFDALMAFQNERQINMPTVGAPAPDFTLDVLDKERLRTGETVTLSSLHGKPVALLFGSYT